MRFPPQQPPPHHNPADYVADKGRVIPIGSSIKDLNMHGILRVIVLLAPAIILPCDCFVSMPVTSRPMSPAAAAASRSHGDGEAASSASSVAAAGKAILCKTAETFKLADLYQLELSIKASLCGMSCQRLGIDPATGSSLLLLSDQARDGLDQAELSERGTSAHTNCDNILTINKSQSVEWIGLELASAGDAEGLVDELRKKADEIEMMMRDQAGTSANGPPEISWVLEYTRMGNVGGHKDRPRHTSKTLCYGVANTLKLPPELDAKSDSACSLVLLDGPDIIRLCLVISGGKGDTKGKGTTDIVQKKWPGRPFQYSSAMNPIAASVIVDILLRMCAKNKMDKTPTLLDPTCGSGTFLAFAVGSGANAIGWDVKESCCEGTRRNLDYLKTALFVSEDGMEPSSSQQLAYRIDNQDAAQVSDDALGKDEVDCAVANLPWGQNTPTYYEENEKILEALRGILRSDATVPVAIISRDSSVQKELERIGFRVLGAASIPQSNFRLPKTSKKEKKRKEVADDDGNDDQDRDSICMVTIAVTD